MAAFSTNTPLAGKGLAHRALVCAILLFDVLPGSSDRVFPAALQLTTGAAPAFDTIGWVNLPLPQAPYRLGDGIADATVMLAGHWVPPAIIVTNRLCARQG